MSPEEVEKVVWAAMEKAVKRGITIRTGAANVHRNNRRWAARTSGGCCAVGCLLLGQVPRKTDYYDTHAARILQIPSSDLWEMISGFDTGIVGKGNGPYRAVGASLRQRFLVK